MTDKLQQATSGVARTGALGWLDRRARRREYWLWMAPLFVLATYLSMTGGQASSLLAGIPMLLAMIRRLHDIGWTGWIAPVINVATNVVSFGLTATMGDTGTLLAGLVHIAALVALGVWPGQPGPNRYGPPPGKPSRLAETFS